MAKLAIIGVLVAMTAVPETAHARHESGCPEYVREWFGEQAHGACSVSFCESRWDEWATNRSSGARGLFQFLRSTWARTSIGWELGWDAAYDGRTNAWAAYELSGAGRRWGEWSCPSWGLVRLGAGA